MPLAFHCQWKVVTDTASGTGTSLTCGGVYGIPWYRITVALPQASLQARHWQAQLRVNRVPVHASAAAVHFKLFADSEIRSQIR